MTRTSWGVRHRLCLSLWGRLCAVVRKVAR